ncbi:MAG: LytR C-terminal domain-containing protein [Acidimicrobiia bacterium]
MNDPNELPGQEPSEPRHAPSGGGGGRGASGFSAARGAALIAVAVLIGVVLLNAIDDGNTGAVGDGGTKSTTPSTTTTTVAKGSASTTTTTKPAPVPPAEVSVLVLNGSGRAGVAGTLTTALKAKGYKTLVPNNASSVRAGTVVYPKTGKTAVCTTLAAGIPGAKVQPMPVPPPTTTDADCIVVVGS